MNRVGSTLCRVLKFGFYLNAVGSHLNGKLCTKGREVTAVWRMDFRGFKKQEVRGPVSSER